MRQFSVKIKPEVFGLSNMAFLRDKGFREEGVYPVLGIVENKLLIGNSDTGEMAELFPRNCWIKELDA